MTDAPYEPLLSYWFGDVGADGANDPSKRALHWSASAEVDQELEERFGALHRAAQLGRLDAWADTARGRLALVVLLDQLSRNLHRGTAGMYANDETALALAEDGVARGDDLDLPPAMALFLYMPFMHAEELAAQDAGIELFTALAERAAPEHRDAYASTVDYAHQHQVIVARFGRFPHRNSILGRETTAEEAAFLLQPGSSF